MNTITEEEFNSYKQERFKEHPTHKGIWVGNCGTILSARKGTGRHMNPYGAKPHPLKVSIMNSGYLHCSVGTIHSLVAKVWLPNPYNLPCVNHKDEDKTNNVVALNDDLSVNIELSNLEWCTNKYNHNYGTHNARVSASLKGKPKSAEHRAKISASLKGKPRPDMKGKPKSAEHRARLSESYKGNRGMKWYKDPDTGKRIYY